MSVYVYVFFVFIKKQSQAISRRPVAHLRLILPLSLLPIILRIFLDFTIKISIFSVNNAVFIEAFVLPLLFVHQNRLVIHFQLLLYIALRCDAERVYYVVLRESVLVSRRTVGFISCETT
jgi:hypothetical protein